MPTTRDLPAPLPGPAYDAEREAAAGVAPQVLLLMGVSGSGKSTVALELQRMLGWPFQEGDDLHPAANVEKMRAGHPLDDADRMPWLRAVAKWVDDRIAAGEPGIITCSNLKRAYRQITVGDRHGVTLVYLKGEEQVIQDRIAQRQHRYMPPSLLQSQFDTLEEPGLDEHPLVVVVHGTIAQIVTELLKRLARGTESTTNNRGTATVRTGHRRKGPSPSG